MELNHFLDHTLLNQFATDLEIENLCNEARAHHFYAICVNPTFVHDAAKLLAQSSVKVCTVIGFPLGASTTKMKLAEATEAIQLGAHELDVVLNFSHLKSGNDHLIRQELSALSALAHQHKALLKVILEISLLQDEKEKLRAIHLACESGADFIKTSTGFFQSKATIEDVSLMMKHKLPHVKVKASGGIRTRDEALQFIELGVHRLGTSRSIDICKKASFI